MANESPCSPNPLLSSACSYGTRCCANRFHPEISEAKACTTCGSYDDPLCCEDSPGYDTPEYWERQGRRLALDNLVKMTEEMGLYEQELVDRPQTVKELMGRARAAGHDSFGIANDPEACRTIDVIAGRIVMHARTGHDSHVPKDDEARPAKFTITISNNTCYQDDAKTEPCKVGTSGCVMTHDLEDEQTWMAEITGLIKVEGQEVLWTHMTHGYSPAQAVAMAEDLVTGLWDECEPAKNQGVGESTHCWCRDVTWDSQFSSNPEGAIMRCYACCRCATKDGPSAVNPIENFK